MIFIFPFEGFFLHMLLRDAYKCEGRGSPKTEKKSCKTNLKKNVLHCNKTGKKVFRVEKKITPFQNVLITSNWFLNDILSLISFSSFAEFEGEESTTSGKYSCDFFNCFFLFDLFILLPFLQVYLLIYIFLRNRFLSLNN